MSGKMLIPALLLGAFAALAVGSMAGDSVTSDEVAHLPAGYTYVQTGDFRLNPQHPPLLKALAAMPLTRLDLKPIWQVAAWREGDDRAFGADFLLNNRLPLSRILFAGRLPMVALGVLMGAVLFRWAVALWGFAAAAGVLLLFAFSPNILAHAHLVTTDAGLACFTVCALYALWCFTAHGRRRDAVWCGVALGCALLAKYSGLLTAALVAALLALECAAARRRASGVSMRSLALGGALIAGIAVLMVAVGYGFPNGVRNYWYGVHQISRDFDPRQPAFLWGRYAVGGFWYYYLLAQWWKTPLPTLLLFAAALLLADWRTPAARRNWFYVLAPIAAFHLAGFFFRPNIGLRHVLPVLPFVFLAAGAAVQRAMASPRGRLVLMCLGAWYVAGTLRTYPHFLAYFNELAGGPAGGIHYLIDSNLEWGQDIGRLAAYIDTTQPATARAAVFSPLPLAAQGVRAGAIGLRDMVWPEEGVTYFVGPSYLQRPSYGGDPALRFRWLKRYRPVDTIGWSIAVYRLSTDPAARQRSDVFFLPRAQWYADAIAQLADIVAYNPQFAEAQQLLARVRAEQAQWQASAAEHAP